MFRMMHPTTHVTLPNGLWLDDQFITRAGLRPLTGYDEAYMLSLRSALSPAHWTSEILSRCVTNLETVNPITIEHVRALSVGDREALLLHLRRLTFGERLSCVLDCPVCGIKLDFDLNVEQLLLPPRQTNDFWFRLPLADSDLTVTFRLPTGADQEAIAAVAAYDPAAAAITLMERCLHQITRDGTQIEGLPNTFVPVLAELMGERDPQAELILNNQCPECEHQFSALLDMGQHLAAEINQRSRHLYREVHLLAWYYHWSESEILQMTRAHREIYLTLLDETLSEARA